MTDYYAEKLSGRRLARCYELAPPRVKQYLEAEIQHVLSRLAPSDAVLELGCGYGRVTLRLAGVARRVIGIDTSQESLDLARELAGPDSRCEFVNGNALKLPFVAGGFDAVICIQNGICAFRVDPLPLAREALRVTRPGGCVLFSSYAEAFWPHRLPWFERQAAEGLVGELDNAATTPGQIVCKDGFRSGTYGAGEFAELCFRLNVRSAIVEVDGSSVFCEIAAPGGHRAAL